MTLPTETIRNDYTGNGSAVTYPYTFKAFAAAQIEVILTDDDGDETVQTNPTHYSLTGVGSASGGNVVFVTAPPAPSDPTRKNVTIKATAAFTQTTDLVNETGFFQDRIETALDRSVRQAQILNERSTRSLQLPEGEAGSETLTVLPPLSERKGRTLAFDSVTGKPVMFSTASTAVSTAMEPVLQADTLALARSSMSVRRADVINVKEWGAVGDGATDDTAAILAAFAHAETLSVGFARFILDGGAGAAAVEGVGRDSGPVTGTKPTVYFPSGHYLVSAAISVSSHTQVIGENAYIRTESTANDILTVSPLNVFISGMIFDGGKYHIRIGGTSYRPESSFIHITDCQFRHATTRCIYTDRSGILPSPGYPMTLQIDNCKSYGSPFLEAHTNGCFVSDCWLAWNVGADDHDDLPLFVHSDTLCLTNILEVPYVRFGRTNVNFTPRIKTDDMVATSTICMGCRWGGEATKTPIAQITCAESSFIMESCATYGVASCYWLICDQMPSHISVKNNRGHEIGGFENTWGIWFNSANIDDGDVGKLCRFDLDLRTPYSAAWAMTLSADKSVYGGAPLNFIPGQSITSAKDSADAVMTNLIPGDGISWWGAPYTATNKYGTGGFGGTESVLGCTLGYFTSNLSTYYLHVSVAGFTPPAAGIYTYSAWVKVAGRALAVFSSDGTTKITHTQELHPGLNFVAARFYHDGVTATAPDLMITGTGTGIRVVLGLMAIHQGEVAGRWMPPGSDAVPMLSRHFYAAAVPTTGSWRVGDIVWNTAPASGSAPAWRCVTAGTPGTWSAMPHLGELRGSATYDPPSLADGVGATTTVTVTGAALGDYAQASFSLDTQGITVTAWVSAANTVSVRFQNESGGVLDLASGTLRARVSKL